MNYSIMTKNDELVMALVHYFITEENYSPIMVKGVKDEIWLENVEGPYRIIRINSNHIHNDEQYKLDIFRTKKVIEQIKKKTLSLKVNTLNILINVADNVKPDASINNISSLVLNNVEEITNDKNMLKIFPKLENKFLKDKEGIDLIVSVTNDINAKTIRDNETFAKIFSPKRIIITPLLILICFIMFIAMSVFGRGSTDVSTLVMFGANVQSLVKAGEFYRLITSIFLHIGIIHLLTNMYSLFVIGHELETFLGKTKFFIVSCFT